MKKIYYFLTLTCVSLLLFYICENCIAQEPTIIQTKPNGIRIINEKFNCVSPCNLPLHVGDEIVMLFEDEKHFINLGFYRKSEKDNANSLFIPFPIAENGYDSVYWQKRKIIANQNVIIAYPTNDLREPLIIWEDYFKTEDVFLNVQSSPNNRFFLIETYSRLLNDGIGKESEYSMNLWLNDREKKDAIFISIRSEKNETGTFIYKEGTNPSFSPDSKWLLINEKVTKNEKEDLYNVSVVNLFEKGQTFDLLQTKGEYGHCQWNDLNPWILCMKESNAIVYYFEDKTWKTNTISDCDLLPAMNKPKISWIGEYLIGKRNGENVLINPITGSTIKEIEARSLYLYSVKEGLYIFEKKLGNKKSELYFYNADFVRIGKKLIENDNHPLSSNFLISQRSIKCRFNILLNYPDDVIPSDYLLKKIGVNFSIIRKYQYINDYIYATNYFSPGNIDPKAKTYINQHSVSFFSFESNPYVFDNQRSMPYSSTDIYNVCNYVEKDGQAAAISESMHQPLVDPDKPNPDFETLMEAWHNPEVRALAARNDEFVDIIKRNVKEVLGRQDRLPKPEKVDYWLLEIERVEGINEN